jgi:hypothetical protein
MLAELKNWAERRRRSNKNAGDWGAMREDERLVAKMRNLTRTKEE